MSNTVKIGIFLTAALVLLGYFILEIEEIRLFSGEARVVEASFGTIAGLDDKAAVRVAGVRVGRVDGIRLADDRAFVSLLLESPVELRHGANAAVANMGLLGDKYIELDPGPASGPPLEEGEILPGTTPVGIDDAMARFNSIGISLDEALTAMKPSESGETVRQLLASLEASAEIIRSVVEANQSQFAGTMENFENFSAVLADELPRVTQQTADVIAKFEEILEENRGDVRSSMERLAEATDTLRQSLEHFEKISSRIAGGEGSVGKLLTEDTAHDQLVDTLASVESGVGQLTETLDRVKKLQLELGFEGYYLDEFEDSRSEFGLKLDPRSGSNRFYQVSIVDDPRGRVRVETLETTATGTGGEVESSTVRTVRTEDDSALSAQVGFGLGQGRFRAGLIESTAGAGFDFDLFNDRLLLSFDTFDFGREDDLNPRMRLTGRWKFHRKAYLVGGLDDFLESDRDSVFLGAGIRWTDDDLKYLLGSIPRN
jgi:phospholipid/cholesterol/gamma-HCH transport system substrate-binding protein